MKVIIEPSKRVVISHCSLTRNVSMRPLLQEDTREPGRPAGITAVAAVLLFYALASGIYAGFTATGRIALSSGAWVIGGGLEILGPGIFLLLAALRAACAIGLLRMHKWALRVGSLLLLYELVQVTPAISSAVGDGRILAIAREGFQILW